MTDNELMQGILKRDRQAFQFLIETYQKQVVKTAFYFTGNMEDAEDLSQDIFLEIISSAASFRYSAALSTWIYRITVNRSLNQLKRNKRREIFQRLGDVFHSGANTATRAMESGSQNTFTEDTEKRNLLNHAIGSLPENQRIAFVLSKHEGLPYKDICEIMNLSLSSVESLIHRAKLNLQQKLAVHFPELKKN
ncbi:MAG: RNA polymerase sigma factor [Bacteroidetes bacterium]|nr:RNA polymerase sigma factor [Bacteroidota bacterium]